MDDGVCLPGLRPGTSVEELRCSRGSGYHSAGQSAKWLLLPSDWPFVGVFYWAYQQSIPGIHGISGFCFRVFAATRSTKSSRPAPTHQSPASCPRMCMSPAYICCSLLAPPHPPGPLPTRPLLSTTSFTTCHRPFPTTPRIPPPSCRPLGPGATRPFDFDMRPSFRLPLIRRDSQRACSSSWLLVGEIPRQQPERKRYLRTTTNPSGNAKPGHRAARHF